MRRDLHRVDPAVFGQKLGEFGDELTHWASVYRLSECSIPRLLRSVGPQGLIDFGELLADAGHLRLIAVVLSRETRQRAVAEVGDRAGAEADAEQTDQAARGKMTTDEDQECRIHVGTAFPAEMLAPIAAAHAG